MNYLTPFVFGVLASLPTFVQASWYPPATAHAEGFLGIVSASSSKLSKALPKDLKLAPELFRTDGTYPVNMFIGQHENFTLDFGDRQVVAAKLYREATFSITVVGPNDPSQRYIYTSSIVVDSIPAMVLGWTLGFPKRLATINYAEDIFTAQFSNRDPILNMAMQSATNIDEGEYIRKFGELKKNMHQIIGRTAEGWTCYDFDWGFDHGTFGPINMQLKLFSSFAGPDLSGLYFVQELDKAPDGLGGMKISTNWKMSNYHSCE